MSSRYHEVLPVARSPSALRKPRSAQGPCRRSPTSVGMGGAIGLLAACNRREDVHEYTEMIQVPEIAKKHKAGVCLAARGRSRHLVWCHATFIGFSCLTSPALPAPSTGALLAFPLRTSPFDRNSFNRPPPPPHPSSCTRPGDPSAGHSLSSPPPPSLSTPSKHRPNAPLHASAPATAIRRPDRITSSDGLPVLMSAAETGACYQQPDPREH